jgi:hypothetical protein
MSCASEDAFCICVQSITSTSLYPFEHQGKWNMEWAYLPVEILQYNVQHLHLATTLRTMDKTDSCYAKIRMLQSGTEKLTRSVH